MEAEPKTKHDGDCTIYAVLDNGNPTDGICTCGYGADMRRKCNYDYIYSQELRDKLLAEKYPQTHKIPDLSPTPLR